MTYIAKYQMVRAVVVEAQLDQPRVPWRDMLATVLADGERFCWRTVDEVDVGTVHRVFVDVYREDATTVQSEILMLTTDWPEQLRAQLPWS